LTFFEKNSLPGSEFCQKFWQKTKERTIATLSCGFFGLVIRYCLKSKCENISCCYGLISVKRNVELESQEEMREMELDIKEEKV
jgi:hypothetical protein